ncbi:EF-hand domain-containing protein [Winogradskyella endarachnes]|nr:hypothetical protein [Winogradskyella endarachnes]
MTTKKAVVSKIQILFTSHFETPECAFNFFDKDGNGTLNKKEIVKF